MPSATDSENDVNAKSEEILKKALKDLNMSLKDKQKLLKANIKTLRETNTTIEKTKEAVGGLKEEITNTIGAAKDSIGVLKEVFKITTVLQFATIAKEMFDFNSELHRIVINAGKSKKELETYKKTVTDLGIAMGATHKDANNVVKTLAKLQYVGTKEDIKGAAEASYGLARAFNLDYEAVTQNTVELQKWGQISAKTTAAMYADTMKVAQANGLTNTAVQRIIKSTTNWSGTLKAFGKSAMDVQRYNMSLSKSVSALEKVGVAADQAIEKIEALMDPENIEANIPAYAALGISITDAITGNIDPERMTAGLKEFGEKLKQMGPIAGAQYAKAMGISYKDAIKAASADMSEASKVDMTPEEKSAEAIKQLTENTKDMVEKMQDGVQKLGATIRQLGPWILLLFPLIWSAIMKIFSRTKKESKKTIKENIKDWLKAEEEKSEMSIREVEKSERQKKKELKRQQKERLKQEKIFLDNLHKHRVQKDSETYKKQKAAYINLVHAKLIAEAKGLTEQWKTKKNALEKQKKLEITLEDQINKATTESMKKMLKERLDDTKKVINELSKEEKKLRTDALSKHKTLNNEKSATGASIDRGYSSPKNSMFQKIAQGLSGLKEGAIKKFSSMKEIASSCFEGLKAKGVAALAGIAGAVKRIPVVGTLVTVVGKAVKFLGKAVGKIVGALKSTVGKIASFGIVMALMSKILSKISEPLEGIMDSVVDSLEPVFKAIVPVLSKLISNLVKSLLPPLLKLLAALLKFFSPLIQILAKVLKALGKILGPLGLGFLEDVANSMEEIAGEKTQKALLEAANNVATTDHDLAKKTEENTEAMSKKEQITVKNGKVSVSKAQGGTSTNSEGTGTGGTENSSASKTENNNSSFAAQTALMNESNKIMEKNNKELKDIKTLIFNHYYNNKNKAGDKAMEIRAGIQQAFNITSGEAIPVSLDIYSTATNLLTRHPVAQLFGLTNASNGGVDN